MYLIFYIPNYRTGGEIIFYSSILKSMVKYLLFISATIFQSPHRKTSYDLGGSHCFSNESNGVAVAYLFFYSEK